MNKSAPQISGINTPAQAMSVALMPVFFSVLMFVPSPALNIRRITPISARSPRKSDVCTQPNRLGPMMSPATISPATCGTRILRATRPQILAATMMMASSRHNSKESIPLSPLCGKMFQPYVSEKYTAISCNHNQIKRTATILASKSKNIFTKIAANPFHFEENC